MMTDVLALILAVIFGGMSLIATLGFIRLTIEWLTGVELFPSSEPTETEMEYMMNQLRRQYK